MTSYILNHKINAHYKRNVLLIVYNIFSNSVDYSSHDAITVRFFNIGTEINI